MDLRRVLAVGRRSQQVLLVAGAVGAGVGLLVAGFDRLTADVALDRVLDLPIGVAAAMPLVGLLLARGILRWTRSGGPSLADEYLRAYHDPGARRIPLREAPGRVAASIATLGFGGALGFEGPALYIGAAAGSAVQRRLRRAVRFDDVRVLLVAGAAAGVAAIFKAPVTGLIFALEVPYQEDLARRMLLPAAMASATGYVAFAAVTDTTPLLPIAGRPPFSFVDLAGAAVVGLACGVLARVFAGAVTRAKAVSAWRRPWLQSVGAGLLLGGCFLIGRAMSGTNLTMGPGYDFLEWSLDPRRGLLLLAGAATLRVAASVLTISGGGAGGLFIPLVLQGALVGRIAGGVFDPSNPTLLPVVGIAAVLGAGYRVPLAAVVFVAEVTGRPGYIVPGLIAAVVAQLVVGDGASVTTYQVAGRDAYDPPED